MSMNDVETLRKTEQPLPFWHPEAFQNLEVPVRKLEASVKKRLMIQESGEIDKNIIINILKLTKNLGYQSNKRQLNHSKKGFTEFRHFFRQKKKTWISVEHTPEFPHQAHGRQAPVPCNCEPWRSKNFGTANFFELWNFGAKRKKSLYYPGGPKTIK